MNKNILRFWITFVILLTALSSAFAGSGSQQQADGMQLVQPSSLVEVLAKAGMQPDWLSCKTSDDCSLVWESCGSSLAVELFYSVNLSHKKQAQGAIDSAFAIPPDPPGLSQKEKEMAAIRRGGAGTCAVRPFIAACESGACVAKPGRLPESIERRLKKLRQEQPPVP